MSVLRHGPSTAEGGLPSTRCAVVIVNYRTAELTCLAVRSALSEIDTARDRIVVVDNASADDSLEVLKRHAVREGWGTAVEVVASPRNGGFGAGNNFGISRVEADAVLLLNSDATLEPGSLETLLSQLEARPEIGLVGPAIRNAAGVHQPSAFRYRTPAGEALEAIDLGLLRRLFARHDPLLPTDTVAPRSDAEWLSFACVLVRSEVFERIGELDEGFFMYFEDLDFCRRAREAGFGLLYCPAAGAVHDEGSSSQEPVAQAGGERRPSYYYEGRARYFSRYYGRAGLWTANAMRGLGAPLGLLRGLAGRARSDGSAPAEREWLDVWTSALAPQPPRRLAASQRRTTARPFVLLDRDGTLVEDHGYTHRVEDYVLLPGVVDGLKQLGDAGFSFAIVTNQSGIGRGYYGASDFAKFQQHLVRDLAQHGVQIEASFYCPHAPDAGCACRKPATGLLEEASRTLSTDLGSSWMIGDTTRDLGAAAAAGCAGAVLVLTGEGEAASEHAEPSVPRARDLTEAAAQILTASSGN